MPIRHGKHFPQDSNWQNAIRALVRSTTQVSSSAAMIPPDPRIAPRIPEYLEVQDHVQVVRAQHTAQGAATLDQLEGFAARDSPRCLIEHVFQVDSQRYFDHAGV